MASRLSGPPIPSCGGPVRQASILLSDDRDAKRREPSDSANCALGLTAFSVIHRSILRDNAPGLAPTPLYLSQFLPSRCRMFVSRMNDEIIEVYLRWLWSWE